MDLPDAESRFKKLLTLWQKCDGYLVLVENGTINGFQLINEAREFLLQQAHFGDEEAYIFAPVNYKSIGIRSIWTFPNSLNQHKFACIFFYILQCPHEAMCPSVAQAPDKACNFLLSYRPMRLTETVNEEYTKYSYIVFKKGNRDDDKTIGWPRMVRPTSVGSRHVNCFLCTHRAKLEKIVVTKRKHSM